LRPVVALTLAALCVLLSRFDHVIKGETFYAVGQVADGWAPELVYTPPDGVVVLPGREGGLVACLGTVALPLFLSLTMAQVACIPHHSMDGYDAIVAAWLSHLDSRGRGRAAM